MNYHIKLHIESEFVDDLLLDLLEIDGLVFQFEDAIDITDQELKEFEQSKWPYPYFSWDPKDVTIVLVTIPLIINSIRGLAKVILDYKVKSEQNKSTRKKGSHQEPVLIIDDKEIPLSEFSDIEELTKFLEKTAKSLPKQIDTQTDIPARWHQIAALVLHFPDNTKAAPSNKKENERKSTSSVTGLGNEVEAIPNLPPTQLLDQTGGTRMTIEQNALRVAEFLRALNEKVIADPEFRRLYGDTGRMDETILRLVTALTTNFQSLEEARLNARLYPNRRRYQEDVADALQALTATAYETENVWRQFRANTLAGITSLIVRVEEETAKPLDQQTPAAGVDVVAVEGTPTAIAPAKSSWLKTALNGLTQFKDFLTLAVDLDKAVNLASPALMDSAKSAFHLLGQLRF